MPVRALSATPIHSMTVALALFILVVPGLSASARAQQQSVRSFDLTLAAGRLASGPRTIRVLRGERVELRWTADRTTTIHLHGYDIELKLEPGTPASMKFEARATGRFPIETHAPSGRHVTLVHVEVHPR